MPTPVIIRDEQPADIPRIARLVTEAFRTAPHSSGTEALIVDALRDARALTVSLVADAGGELTGHIAISPVTTTSGDRGWFGLGPIAVAPAHQGKGIGTQLMHAALDRLREAGASGCVVLGNPAFYSRFGFVREEALVLPGVPQAYFLATTFTGAMASGTVSYHDGFSAGAGESGPPDSRP
ncbi:MAG: N-acetyltransferase [Vicinamibacterales bacterium]